MEWEIEEVGVTSCELAGLMRRNGTEGWSSIELVLYRGCLPTMVAHSSSQIA